MTCTMLFEMVLCCFCMKFLCAVATTLLFLVNGVFATDVSPVTSYSVGFDKRSLYLVKNAISAAKKCDWVMAQYYVRKTLDDDLYSFISWFQSNHVSIRDNKIHKPVVTGDLYSYMFSNCHNVFLSFQSSEDKGLVKSELVKKNELNRKENNEVINILLKNSKISDSQISRIIKIAQFDFNVANQFLIWAERGSHFNYAIELLRVLPNDIKYKKKIIDHKMRLIREVLYSKKDDLYNVIYELSIDHKYDSGVLFAEYEWLSGWIAISFLKNKDLAIKHFTKLLYFVKTPVSIARASYWLGRVYEIYGDTSLSKKWYKISSHYGKTFHGQVAAYKLQSEDKLKIDIGKLYNGKNIKNCNISTRKKKELDLYLKYVYVMALLNETKIASFWIDKLLSSYEGVEYSMQYLVNIAKATGMPYIAIYAFKYIEKVYGIVEAEHSFPILYIDYVNTIDPKNSIFIPVCYGIMRQESEFNMLAVSNAGAVGLMQIMPFIAKEMIKKLGLKAEHVNLYNPKHSIVLGGALLSQLMKKYHNSVVLSVAAYNAGDVAVDRWIKKIGDIRDIDNIDDCIEWVENIPYKETRQYVFRVIENARVYEKLIKKLNNENTERSIHDFIVVKK